MPTIVYIILIAIVSLPVYAIFGIGLVHGGKWAWLPIPFAFSILLAPLYIYRKIHSRWKYAYLVYLFPLILIILPVSYVAFYKPYSEETKANNILKNVRVTPISEDAIKNEGGSVIGLKLTYSTYIPEDINNLIELNDSMSSLTLPSLYLTQKDRPSSEDLLQANYSKTTKDGLPYYEFGVKENYADLVMQQLMDGKYPDKIIPTSNVKPGDYITEIWFLGAGVGFTENTLCRTKYFDNYANSQNSPYTNTEQPIIAVASTRVDLTNYAGTYYFDHLVNYEIQNKFSGSEMLNAARTLESCPQK